MTSKITGRSILIVEDEPLIAMEVVEAFKAAGAVVTATFSFKQALILVEHDGLAAAILDHALGDSDSSRLCARLKERGVPFVIYTGFSNVKGHCADGPLVQKPAPATELIATVEALL